MADMVGGGAMAASHGRAAVPVTSATSRRPAAAPAPTSSPSGIRGPRKIMEERAAREAAREAQREAAERQRIEQARAEEEAHLLEEARRRHAERHSAGVAQGQGTNTDAHIPQEDIHHHSQQQAHETSQPPRGPPVSLQSQLPHHSRQNQAQTHQDPSATQQPPPSQAYLSQGSAAQRRGSDTRPAEPQAAATEPTKARNSFPHAFERWETLSAHWEGLTSYWIRKLEQNKDDINRDPLSQQLARQVTDLSAAGANLFHAVVELQRLRASSERKFQRWFFETRSELERAREVNAMLEKEMNNERRDRADAIREAVDHERGVSKTQKQLAEMRKELAISKEEARRAWEELGRREQEERDRTLSLQSGHPTIVGGVQVVPMTQSNPTRYTGKEPASSYQGEQSHTPTERAAGPAAAYSPPQDPAGGAPGPSSSQPAYREGEYVRDAQGNYILDSHGNKIPYIAPPSTYSGSERDADEYETPATTNPPSGNRDPQSTTAGVAPQTHDQQGQWTPNYSNPQDYSGEGYGQPGWDTVPRHHHPTRLSDVIEEDERSRTSASQLSRA